MFTKELERVENLSFSALVKFTGTPLIYSSNVSENLHKIEPSNEN